MEKYIIQKTQKIVSALYLITDLIKDSDAIKWEIREEGISLVSSALMIDTLHPIDKEHSRDLYVLSANKIISYINIGLVSSLISSMNAGIVIREIDSVLSFVKKNDKDIHPPGYILSDSFFASDFSATDSKGQTLAVNADNVPDSASSAVSEKSTYSKDYTSAKLKQSDRKEIIINILKKDSNLTIKDFTSVIKDCSEKTIQRELASLVEQGRVLKAGERRWSTYSLPDFDNK
jgi:predicted transcriptional regulator